jgi:hypothetical protein
MTPAQFRHQLCRGAGLDVTNHLIPRLSGPRQVVVVQGDGFYISHPEEGKRTFVRFAELTDGPTSTSVQVMDDPNYARPLPWLTLQVQS